MYTYPFRLRTYNFCMVNRTLNHSSFINITSAIKRAEHFIQTPADSWILQLSDPRPYLPYTVFIFWELLCRHTQSEQLPVSLKKNTKIILTGISEIFYIGIYQLPLYYGSEFCRVISCHKTAVSLFPSGHHSGPVSGRWSIPSLPISSVLPSWSQ